MKLLKLFLYIIVYFQPHRGYIIGTCTSYIASTRMIYIIPSKNKKIDLLEIISEIIPKTLFISPGIQARIAGTLIQVGK